MSVDWRLATTIGVGMVLGGVFLAIGAMLFGGR